MATASLPPFTLLVCFRRVFISRMVAPLASNSLVASCCSCRVMSPAGAERIADPPPEISVTIRVSASAFSASWRISCPAEMEASSGTGCPASRNSIRAGFSVCPYFTATTPREIRSPRICSRATAMRPDAFPKPRTTIDRKAPRSISSLCSSVLTRSRSPSRCKQDFTMTAGSTRSRAAW